MKTSTNKRLKIVILLIVIFILAIFSKLIYTMLDDQETSSHKPLVEHYNLFTKEGKRKLQLLATTTSRNRHATSHYLYGKRFDVFVLKIELINNHSLNKIIRYKNKPSHIAMNAVYSGLSNFNMDMNIKAGKSVLASIVYFKFSGDSITALARTDSLYCYYYKFKTFSINYNDEPYDIIAKANLSAIPASVAFKKDGKFLFIILMTVASGKEEMPQNLLYDIIKK